MEYQSVANAALQSDSTEEQQFFYYNAESAPIPQGPRIDSDVIFGERVDNRCTQCKLPVFAYMGGAALCMHCYLNGPFDSPLELLSTTRRQSSFHSSASPVLSRQASNDSLQSMGSGVSTSSKRGQKIPGGYMCFELGCYSVFDRPGDLKHHQRKHQAKEDRPHGCDLCGQRFLYPKDLRRHQTAVHPGSYPPPPSDNPDKVPRPRIKRRRSKSPLVQRPSCHECRVHKTKCVGRESERCRSCEDNDLYCTSYQSDMEQLHRKLHPDAEPMTTTIDSEPKQSCSQPLATETISEQAKPDLDATAPSETDQHHLRRSSFPGITTQDSSVSRIAAARRKRHEIDNLKHQAERLDAPVLGNKGAIEVAKHWLNAIKSLIISGHRANEDREINATVAIENVMLHLDLIDAGHDFDTLTKR